MELMITEDAKEGWQAVANLEEAQASEVAVAHLKKRPERRPRRS
jgi:hypothetical protein